VNQQRSAMSGWYSPTIQASSIARSLWFVSLSFRWLRHFSDHNPARKEGNRLQQSQKVPWPWTIGWATFFCLARIACWMRRLRPCCRTSIPSIEVHLPIKRRAGPLSLSPRLPVNSLGNDRAVAGKGACEDPMLRSIGLALARVAAETPTADFEAKWPILARCI
jgi:hypothetical protein